ncbi:unnamed protein product [Mytilus coruscus]|uniref:Ig-like domain-containing protein n=1 Tax=Mytilus coruscus TaxID=42192 RepID=A0A6J8DUL1_MYTCO|nr:unnamed protein product [Mytilus coruscus]
MDNKEEFIGVAASYLTTLRCSSMITDLKKGLETYDVLKLVIKENLRDLFEYKKVRINSSDLLALLKPRFSHDPRKKEHEELVLVNFHHFVESIQDNELETVLKEGDVILTTTMNEFIRELEPKHILVFATGSSRIPTTGFHPKPAVTFHHDNTQYFPCAVTCSNELQLFVNAANTNLYVFASNFLVGLMNGENISLNPGDENLYSIFTGDTLTLQCPVDSSKRGEVRWSYSEGTMETILSIGYKLNAADFKFIVAFTNQPKHGAYLRIYNITLKKQTMYRCYYSMGQAPPKDYKYNIRLANVTNSMIRNPNGTVCCVLHGRNISAIKCIWEQRTLYDEHIRFIESVQKNYSGPSERNATLAMRKHNHLMSCLNLNINGTLKYDKEGQYICIAQFSIYGRNQVVDKTTSIKIENIQDRPLCIQDTMSQHSILGDNIRICMNFYSKPKYSAISFRKNHSELKFGDIVTVSRKIISLDVYNVTVMVSGYEIMINITEFSEEDVGNYTVSIINEFGYCNCTVQLLFEGINVNRYPRGNVIEGQGVLFVCQSFSRKTANNYSWTKNGIIVSNTSFMVIENVTQDDNGNYTCRMKNKQRYVTKNELLIINPSRCTAYLTETHGFLLMKRFLGFGIFLVLFVFLVAFVIGNIFIHLYCKKLKRGPLESDAHDISRERIEITEADNGYHTINEDNFRVEDTEIENQSEITSSIRAMDIAEVQFPGAASGGNELQIEEDDYLHPYCTMMQNAIEMHEYKSTVPGVVERDGPNVVLNRKLGRLYENLKF